MFETVVISTDGSRSAARGVRAALDLAGRFDATVHALYVVDTDEVSASPSQVRDDIDQALRTAGDQALAFVEETAVAEATTSQPEVVTAIREGTPETEIISYAKSVDADVIAMGTRGRHGEHAYLLGSVAEAVVRRSPIPVLTVRQLEGDDEGEGENRD